MRRFLLIITITCLAATVSAARNESSPPATARGGGLQYTVMYARVKPVFTGDWAAYWNSPAWRQAGTVSVDQWHSASSSTRPVTHAKALYDETGIRILWRVQDTYIYVLYTAFMDPVSRDSTVEFFFEPAKALGYINLETNAVGTMLWRVQRPEPGSDVTVTYPPKYVKENPTPEVGLKIQVRKSLPQTQIVEAIETPTTWYLESFIPVEILDYAWGLKASDLSGATWRGNFYKIIESSAPAVSLHKHYGAWSSIGTVLNFHQPAIFAPITFEPMPRNAAQLWNAE
ncbi:MAG: carbohydrate-binding family 9-like protein [Candidatus Sumerlaeia bacterium]